MELLGTDCNTVVLQSSALWVTSNTITAAEAARTRGRAITFQQTVCKANQYFRIPPPLAAERNSVTHTQDRFLPFPVTVLSSECDLWADFSLRACAIAQTVARQHNLLIMGVAAFTYKDAVEGAVIKQRRLVQLQSVRLVTARLQDLIAGARTEREQLSARDAVRRRRREAQQARVDEPPMPLPTHLIAFYGAARAVPWFARARSE